MAGEVSVTIVGNLADDPELRYTQGGVAVVSVRVGSTPRTLNRSTNEWVDGETVWVRCTAWREAAENIAQSLTKGSRVVVTGRLKAPSAYQTAQGEARASLELEIDEIGPSLRYATASVTRRAREGGAAVESPWGEAKAPVSGANAWANPAADPQVDEAPF
jgi:single-strand DNA-binding protein